MEEVLHLNETDDRILEFISRFRGSEDTFLHGCCFWFANILFIEFGFEIVYEPIEGHFLAMRTTTVQKDGACYDVHEYFDIRGNVTDKYRGLELYPLQQIHDSEPKWYSHLMRDCRDFIEPDD